MEDRVNTLFYLNALQMHPKDTMNNFIMKFRHAIKAVIDVSQESHPPPTDFYLINLFLRKCLHVVPTGSNLQTTLLEYHRRIRDVDKEDDLPFTLADMEYDLGQIENNNRNTQPSPTHHRAQANLSTTKTKVWQRNLMFLLWWQSPFE